MLLENTLFYVFEHKKLLSFKLSKMFCFFFTEK